MVTNDEAAVKRYLVGTREKLACLRRFLIVDDEDPKTMASFYRTVVLYMLLYGRETGVPNNRHDAAAAEVSQTMLSRHQAAFYPSGREWRVGLYYY